MAKNNNLTDFLTDIANTIRNTDGTATTPLTDANKINPQNFSTRIVNYQNKTVTPSTSQQSITRDNGYMALGTVTVNAIPSLSGDAAEANVLSGKTFYSNSYTKKTGSMTNNGSVTEYVGYGDSYTIPEGYHDGTGTVSNSDEPGTIDVTDLTITPNALSGSWNSSTNKYIVSQASKTATMQSTVTAAGYVSSTVGTKNTGTATVSAPSNLEIPKATFEVSGASVKTTSSGAGYISASTTVGTIGSTSVSFGGSITDGTPNSTTTITATTTSPSNKGAAVNYNDNKCGGSSEASYYVTISASGTGGASAASYSTTYTNNAGYLSAHSGTAAKSGTGSAVSTTSSDTNYIKADNTSSITANAVTVSGSTSLSGSNVTLSDTNNGIAVSASGSASATAGADKTLSVKDTYMLNNVTVKSAGVSSTAITGSTKYISDITVPATKTLNSVTLTPGQTTTTLTTLTLNGTATAITNLINYGTIGSATTTVSSVTSNNAGNIYIPHKMSGVGNVYVAPYTSGSTFTYYKVISSGALATGSATPSASYATLSSAGSSATSVTSQYFKITPTASVGTAGWISSISNGTVQNYTVRSASVTPSATLVVSASALTSTTTIGGQYFTITPSASVGTSGWVSSINDGTAKNYQVSNHTGSVASVSGTNTFSYSTNSTWSTSNTSSGIYASAYATGVSKRYTVSTAGWISGGTYGGTDGTLSSSTYYLTGLTVASGKTLSSITNNGTLSDIINNGTISSITNNASIDYIQNTDPDGSIDIGNEGDIYIDNSGRVMIGDNSNGGQIDIHNQEYSFDIVSMQGNTVTLAEYSDGPTYHIVTNDDGMLTMCSLPTSTSGSSSGTNQGTITQSSTTTYLNIPKGWNTSNKYYTISALATQTLPSSTSSSSSGTYKTSITPSNSSQYLNIPTGYQSTSQYYTISAIPQVKVQSMHSSSTSSSSYRYLWCNSSVAACYAFKNQSGAGNYQKGGSLTAGTNTWVGDCSNSTSYRNSMLFVGGQFTTSSTINLTWSSSTSSSTTTGSYTYTPSTTCYGIIFKIYRYSTSSMYIYPIEIKTGNY
jgi:hypothetical protein